MQACLHIIDFSQLYKFDRDLIGKNAYQLGKLKYLGIPIPDGFVITTAFFEEFLQQTGIGTKIKEIQSLNHPAIEASVARLFLPIQKKVMHTPISQNLTAEIYKFYRKLSGIFKETSLDIFSSARNNKSVSYTNVKGDANLLMKIKEIWISDLNNPSPVVVQKNVGSKNKIKTLSNDPLISDQNLATIAKKIQNLFYFPQEIEYVVKKNKIYVTSVKPFTGIVDSASRQTVQIKRSQKILIKGISINRGIATGPVKVLNNNHKNAIHVKNGEIIVLSEIGTSLYDKIKNAKAIVIDSILKKPLDRMIYRKFVKIPTIEGAENATKLLKNGNVITVNGVSGEIYSGRLI